MNIAIGSQWAAAFVVLFAVLALGVYAVPGNDGMGGFILLIFAWPWIFLRLDTATTVIGLLVLVALNALIVFILGAAFGRPLVGGDRTRK